MASTLQKIFFKAIGVCFTRKYCFVLFFPPLQNFTLNLMSVIYMYAKQIFGQVIGVHLKKNK